MKASQEVGWIIIIIIYYIGSVEAYYYAEAQSSSLHMHDHLILVYTAVATLMID